MLYIIQHLRFHEETLASLCGTARRMGVEAEVLTPFSGPSRGMRKELERKGFKYRHILKVEQTPEDRFIVVSGNATYHKHSFNPGRYSNLTLTPENSILICHSSNPHKLPAGRNAFLSPGLGPEVYQQVDCPLLSDLSGEVDSTPLKVRIGVSGKINRHYKHWDWGVVEKLLPLLSENEEVYLIGQYDRSPLPSFMDAIPNERRLFNLGEISFRKGIRRMDFLLSTANPDGRDVRRYMRDKITASIPWSLQCGIPLICHDELARHHRVGHAICWKQHISEVLPAIRCQQTVATLSEQAREDLMKARLSNVQLIQSLLS